MSPASSISRHWQDLFGRILPSGPLTGSASSCYRIFILMTAFASPSGDNILLFTIIILKSLSNKDFFLSFYGEIPRWISGSSTVNANQDLTACGEAISRGARGRWNIFYMTPSPPGPM
jgi:hypothetical protein